MGLMMPMKSPVHPGELVRANLDELELTVAAAALDDGAVRAEAADVIYHLLVLLRARGVAFDSVVGELETRSRRSGHEEKAARSI